MAEDTPVYDVAAERGPGTFPSFSFPTLSVPKVGAPEVYAAGAGLEIFSTIAQSILAGKREKAVSRYNQQVAEANARAAEQAAEIEALQQQRRAVILRQDQVLLGEANVYQEARAREQQERVLGQTRAIVGASGILLSGSPLTVYEESVRQQEMDILAARYQTTLQQRALGEEAVQAEYAAELARYGGAERLRVGKQQAGLIRAQEQGGYGAAALTRAVAAGSKGLSTYGALKEREAYLDVRRKRPAPSAGVKLPEPAPTFLDPGWH